MVQAIRSRFTKAHAALGAGVTTASVWVSGAVSSAHAAASPTTGVDWTADLITPVKTELTLVVLAALGIFVLFMSIRYGKKLFKTVSS